MAYIKRFERGDCSIYCYIFTWPTLRDERGDCSIVIYSLGLRDFILLYIHLAYIKRFYNCYIFTWPTLRDLKEEIVLYIDCSIYCYIYSLGLHLKRDLLLYIQH